MKKALAALSLLSLLLSGCSRADIPNASPAPGLGPTASQSPGILATPGLPSGAQPSPEAGAAESVWLWDGSYQAEADDESTAQLSGWRDYLSIRFENGSIESVDFDAKNGEGRLKSSLSSAEYPMSPPPGDWMPQLEAQIKAAKSPEDIQGIAGASLSSENARRLFQDILEQART